MNRGAWFKKLVMPAFFLIVFLGFNFEAGARAGGGSGFSGGGFSSSGGGFSRGGFSGGSRNSGSSIALLYLIFNYPYISIPLILFLIFLTIWSSKGVRQTQIAAKIRRRIRRQETAELEKAETDLTKRDPDFTRHGLCKRVEKSFIVIQNAWTGQNMKPARHFISDGIYERFSLQLEMNKASLLHNQMSEIKIISSEVVAIRSDKFFDSVDIKITAQAVDRFFSIKDGRPVLGGPNPEIFTEYWTLLRRPGAKTKADPALLENYCPNCGAPLELLDRTECPACKAMINSGEYDWVLTEITQESEYRCLPHHNVPGLDQFVEKDPAFSVCHIEDRTSVVFCRYIAAEFFADIKYIVKLSEEEFIHLNQSDFTPLKNGYHRFYADSAVGSVELLEIMPGGKQHEFDFLRVQVCWSGHIREAKVPGLIKPEFNKSRLFRHEFVLKRKKGIKSSEKNILTSIHCPNCGAPETKNMKAYCEYCKTPLNDGSRDWILHDIRNFSGYAGDLPETSTYSGELHCRNTRTPCPDNEMLIAGAVRMMLVDNVISAQEKQLLEHFATFKRVSPERLEVIISSVQEGTIRPEYPDDPVLKLAYLKAMALMCLSDGKAAREELKLMESLGCRLGFSSRDVRNILNTQQKNLYKSLKNTVL
ncbi:TIM44-like domain-containing protein [Lentisphaerota bacterium ZTH]|nr:TIM44-like domain-containing protein [Lentisphaerota bacterium]WET06450.1 TIM44-like domain-containing protein [Lentisphaerota bacterium ZTH]